MYEEGKILHSHFIDPIAVYKSASHNYGFSFSSCPSLALML